MSKLTSSPALDHALEQWTSAQALPSDRIAAMRNEILSTGPEVSQPLGVDWWLAFRAEMDESLRKNLLGQPQWLPTVTNGWTGEGTWSYQG
jgi:hypothetical protein